jgi:hypothetical protein
MRRRIPACGLLLYALALVSSARGALHAQGAAADNELPKGVVLPDVPEKRDPSQTFALYLPPDYSPAKHWPVIYAFDWAARGKVPADLYAPAAQKRGYIVIGSNNSRNGSARESLDAAMALWNDTRVRFSIDPKQVYATGFSGASRSAFVFADQCGCVQGVIAVGAGLPPLNGPLRSLPFGVFMTLGLNDFNYTELVALEQQLDTVRVPNRLRRFDGDHQWPAAEILAEGVDWMQLLAMRQERRPKDEAFIAEVRAASLERARAYEKAGDLLSAYEEYHKSADEFSGLADTAEFTARAAEMRKSPELQKAEKQERDDIARQKRLVGDIEQQLTSTPAGSIDAPRRFGEISPMAADLRDRADRADRAKDPREVRVLYRATSDVFATAYEGGLSRFRQGDLPGAELFFEVAAVIAPKSPGPPFELAKLYARQGDKKRALKSLEVAVSKGVHKPESLRNAPEFETLHGEAKYQELLAQLEHAPAK